MAEREHILANFQACTDIENIDECIAILEQHDWNLEAAVQAALSLGPGEVQGPLGSMGGLDEAPPPYPMDFHSSAFQPYQPLNSRDPPLYDLSQGGSNLQNSPSFETIPTVVGETVAASTSDSRLPPYPTPGPSVPFSSSASSFQSFSQSSLSHTRLLHFTVEHRERNISLHVPDCDSVGRLKELLETEVGVAKSKMHLGGWVTKNDTPVEDDVILKDLKLPSENTLFLLTSEVPSQEPSTSNGESPTILERLGQTFTLNITYKNKNQTYNLKFSGSKTVQEVKRDVYSIIDVPVRHQIWSGWPDAAKDESMTIAGIGIAYPVHHLEVTKSSTDVNVNRVDRPENAMENQDDSQSEDETIEVSDDDYEDAHENFNLEEEIFSESTTRNQQPLIPEDIPDELTALEHFSNEFGNRYGECHPVFYLGPLEDAIKDALQTKARDRKMLAIYLHHDKSIQANVFCSQILCAETIVSYLSSNFLTWAWDLTSDINKARLLSKCSQHFGTVAANTVRHYTTDQLPLLLLISRNRGVNEVVNVIHANITLDELMTQLIHAVEVFTERQQGEIAEEDERTARERMLQEQDEAYQESLAADRAKEEQKKREREEQHRIEEAERMRKEEEDMKRQEEEAEKMAIQQSVAEQLPDEPDENCGQTLAMIRFRMPGGETMSRRFLVTNPLQVLLNFITSKGFHMEEYKVLTTFPRRDLTQTDGAKTLEELKMYPQETFEKFALYFRKKGCWKACEM